MLGKFHLILYRCQVYFILILFAFTLLSTQSWAQSTDKVLPSWAEGDGSVKQKIIDFVEQVTDKNSPHYVPESIRVATFDMDGTLICEKPHSMNEVMAINYLKKVASESPTLSQIQPYKAAQEGDRNYLGPNFLQVLITAYMGYPQSKYRAQALEFINTQIHPRYNVVYGELFYQPMLELLEYLKANQFDVYVVSGSWQGFVREVGHAKLGFAYSHLIGSRIGLDFQINSAGDAVFLRSTEQLQPPNVHEGKPENIQAHIGIKPVLAFGNSSGDQDMYEYASSNKTHLILSLEHDDEAREYVYPSKVKFQEGWIPVSMKNNFKTVFSSLK